MENLRWIAAAALSAYACHLAVHQTTPVDRALPLIALAVTLLARLSYPAVMLGVPLLILAEIAVADESLRLLMFGAIVASAFAVAGCGLRVAESVPAVRNAPERLDALRNPQPATRSSNANLLIALTSILLLRWLPLGDVIFPREIFLLAVSAATVAVLGRTPFAVAVAVITALITPAMPLRTFVIPVAVFLVAAAARFFGMPRLQLTWPSAAVLAFVMLFFPWSGIMARAFPYFLRKAEPERHRTVVAQALAAHRSATYDVPEGATRLVLSGANVAHMRRGALLGRIHPGNIPVRIGDASDWGYLRRDAWYRARNPLPDDSAGKVRGYGYSAWVDGAGRVPLPRGARKIRVTAAALPPNAVLQVEGFE